MDTPSPRDSDTSEYDQMLERLDSVIEEIERKVENGRIRKPEHDKTRIQYYRAMGYLVRSQLKVIEARDLADMKERLEALEERRSSDDYKLK